MPFILLVNHGHYLGLPSLFGKNKREVFAFIKERVEHGSELKK